MMMATMMILGLICIFKAFNWILLICLMLSPRLFNCKSVSSLTCLRFSIPNADTFLNCFGVIILLMSVGKLDLFCWFNVRRTGVEQSIVCLLVFFSSSYCSRNSWFWDSTKENYEFRIQQHLWPKHRTSIDKHCNH